MWFEKHFSLQQYDVTVSDMFPLQVIFHFFLLLFESNRKICRKTETTLRPYFQKENIPVPFMFAL